MSRGRPPTPVPLSGSVPKHAQLRDALASLAAAELAPEDAIPSERELMERYAVSRATVRKAIEALVSEGVLHRVHGKGTFVARPRVESHLHLASFTQDMRRRGKTPSTAVLQAGAAVPPRAVAVFFQLDTGQPAWRVERLRSADGEPMAHEVGWYPVALLPDLDRHELAGSMYDLFAREYDLIVDTAEQTVWGEVAEGDLARLLDTPPRTALLVFDRASRSRGIPLERVVSRYRADRYQLHISLDRSMPADVTPAAAGSSRQQPAPNPRNPKGHP
jgi:GntR family transcriptional regulator